MQTAVLAVEAAEGDKAFGRYLSQALVEAEEDANAAQGTFDATRPPDRRADELRGRLDEPLPELAADIGDVVANTETGARCGMSLAWVVVGVVGICLGPRPAAPRAVQLTPARAGPWR